MLMSLKLLRTSQLISLHVYLAAVIKGREESRGMWALRHNSNRALLVIVRKDWHYRFTRIPYVEALTRVARVKFGRVKVVPFAGRKALCRNLETGLLRELEIFVSNDFDFSVFEKNQKQIIFEIIRPEIVNFGARKIFGLGLSVVEQLDGLIG
jgi:hypothetical protein